MWVGVDDRRIGMRSSKASTSARTMKVAQADDAHRPSAESERFHMLYGYY